MKLNYEMHAYQEITTNIFNKAHLDVLVDFSNIHSLTVLRFYSFNLYGCNHDIIFKHLEENFPLLLSNSRKNYVVLDERGYMNEISIIQRGDFFEVHCNIYASTTSGTKVAFEKIKSLFLSYMKAENSFIKAAMIWYQIEQGGLKEKIIAQEIHYDETLSLKYPYIKNIEEKLEDFLQSKSTLLLIKGEPGTGKTSLIRQIIARKGKKTYQQNTNFHVRVGYATDEEVFLKDGLYNEYIDASFEILVLEDADALLAKRSAYNNAVTRILNASDGIIQVPNNKIIISTNLTNISEIDEAPLREGRCYDIFETQTLTLEQAKALGDYIELPKNSLTKKHYSLAEIYKLKSDIYEQSKRCKNMKIGF